MLYFWKPAVEWEIALFILSFKHSPDKTQSEDNLLLVNSCEISIFMVKSIDQLPSLKSGVHMDPLPAGKSHKDWLRRKKLHRTVALVALLKKQKQPWWMTHPIHPLNHGEKSFELWNTPWKTPDGTTHSSFNQKTNGNIFFGSLWLLVELAVIYIYTNQCFLLDLWACFYWGTRSSCREDGDNKGPGRPVSFVTATYTLQKMDI